MTTPSKKRFLCQQCGRLTDASGGRCGRCGGNPVIQSGCSVSQAPASSERQAPRVSARAVLEQDEVRDQLESVLRETRILGDSISSMERELIVARAGLETLLGEMAKRGILAKKEFIGKWAAQAKADVKGGRLKEEYARKKWEIVGRGPEKCRALLDEAERLMASSEWDRAYRSFKSAEAASGRNFALTAFVARFALETERFSEAERFSGKLLGQKPLPLENLKLAALSCMFSGNAAEAQAHADRWIKEAGECYEPLLIKAFAKIAAGRWSEAGRCSEKAMEMEDSLVPHLILAFSLMRREKRRTARKVLEKASRFYPSSPEIKHMQHALYLLDGSLKEAVSVKSLLVEADDLNLCRKRERFMSANKIESILETVKPDMEMVLGDMGAGTAAYP